MIKDFRLLIHHHAIAYRDGQDRLHLPSFIGRWVNALASHVGQIGLLLCESDALRPDQDEMVQAGNVVLWSLGPPGRTWDRIARIRRLRKACAQAAGQADGLLVRGVTPRQSTVWDATPVSKKAFLLVGSLLQSRPNVQPSFWSIYEALMWHWRRVEVMRISRQGTLLANSPLLVEELARLKRSATFVPTSTIRLDEFSPLRVRELSTPRRIIFCGRVVLAKGVIELLQAVARLNMDQPCVLDIIGPVEDGFRKACDQEIENLGISGRVSWHGRIPYGDALFAFYRQADALVLPSHYEGFPHVIWEAAASCCPVISTRVGGIPALWKDGEHGLLTAARDVPSLVEAMTRLFNDEGLRHRLIGNAHAYAMEFTVESCAGRLVDVLYENGWK